MIKPQDEVYHVRLKTTATAIAEDTFTNTWIVNTPTGLETWLTCELEVFDRKCHELKTPGHFVRRRFRQTIRTDENGTDVLGNQTDKILLNPFLVRHVEWELGYCVVTSWEHEKTRDLEEQRGRFAFETVGIVVSPFDENNKVAALEARQTARSGEFEDDDEYCWLDWNYESGSMIRTRWVPVA